MESDMKRVAVVEAFQEWLYRHEENTGRWAKLTFGEREALLDMHTGELLRDLDEAKMSGYYLRQEQIEAHEGGGCGDVIGG